MKKRLISIASIMALSTSLNVTIIHAQPAQPSETSSIINTSPKTTESANELFYKNIDIEYSLGVMGKLTSFVTNKDLGFRTAGSFAELQAADYLYSEMKNIGLNNVRKEAVTVDTWTFKNADLSYSDLNGNNKTIEMSAFQVNYVTENEELEIIYAGKGTDKDYEGLDVKNKIVLIDIDQYNDWWINWPAYQAKVKGAKAVVAVNTDGYCTYSPDTVGVQDFCGPEDVPAFSISVTQANELKKAVNDSNGVLKVVLNSDSRVKRDGTSYNIIGEIPGKTDEVIYLIAHYDSYYRAFSDNTSGTATVMGIAKALIKSGYKPNKTIRIITHGAEEWGLADSRYDWARGATLQIEKHPEWAKDAFMLFNIDGGVVDSSADGFKITVPYELSEVALQIGKKVEGSPLKGKLKTSSPTYTWTEDFVYSKAGIPVMASGMYGSTKTGTYHSSSDLREPNQYSDEVFKYAHKLYGSYIIAFDNMPIKRLNYSTLMDNMAETVDKEIISDSDNLLEAMNKAKTQATLLNKYYDKVSKTEVASFNTKLNNLYGYVQNNLFTLDWNEEFQFVHQYKQSNVLQLKNAINALEAGDITTALDEYLWQIDMNWYAYSFDKETYHYFVNQVLGENARNSWGSGYLKSNADLWEVIRSLQDKSNGDDTSKEITLLKKALKKEEADLANVVKIEINAINQFTKDMENLMK